MENINNNKFSKRLNEIFKGNIKLSFVSKKSVIVITNNDECYEFKRNNIQNITIALSDNESKVKSTIEKSSIKELSYKQIADVKNGSCYSVARTFDGKVYCWGDNCMGLLGIGSNDFERPIPELNPFLNDKNIIDICCGRWHTLVLTSSGDVFAWGYNDYGQIGIGMSDTIKYQSTPLKLDAFNREKVKGISCGNTHSLALTESGKVYGWGLNCVGQLGFGNNVSCDVPKLVNLSKLLIIEKISCGEEHSLLLSRDGNIYMCGENICVQVDFSNPVSILTPTMLSHSEKFIDIASHRCFSATISVNSVSYIWGNYGKKVITEPKETEFKSFNEVFEHCFGITFEPNEGKVIRFDDDFTQNGRYQEKFKYSKDIGSGNYGEVFEVVGPPIPFIYGGEYAVKKIKFTVENEKEFMKELETSPIIYKLQNPKIVKYLDVWLENDYIFKNLVKTYTQNFILHIQMELCDKSLNVVIEEIKDSKFCLNGSLTQLGYYIASGIFIEILEGVNYLHKQNPPIIHRDLNPSNIMLKIKESYQTYQTEGLIYRSDFDEFLNRNGFIKITDFGLATIHEYAKSSHTKGDSHLSGNLNYLAPEVENGREYDTRADIYSLGIVLQELFQIDINSNHDGEEDNISSLLISKYKNLKILCIEMKEEDVAKRIVSIEEVLKEKHLWALNFKEFNVRKEIEEVLNSNESNEFIFKLLEEMLLFPNEINMF